MDGSKNGAGQKPYHMAQANRLDGCFEWLSVEVLFLFVWIMVGDACSTWQEIGTGKSTSSSTNTLTILSGDVGWVDGEQYSSSTINIAHVDNSLW